MKTLQINTTQNVHINFELANVGQRLLAFVLDNILKMGYLYLIYGFFDFKFLNEIFSDDSWSLRAIHVITFLPITFYTLASETLMNGQTLGKRILKIRVINIDGFKPSLSDYIMRWFLRLVDFNFFLLVLVYLSSLGLGKYNYFVVLIFMLGKMVGFFLIIFTKNNQRMGDIVANTVVVALKDQADFSQTIIENLTETYKPTYPNVIKLSDNDARIIKDTYNKAKKDKDYKTLIKLRQKIEEVTGVSSKGKTDIDFIGIILKDYNYYTQNM